ncbi:MAG TPA: hypothetical protein VF707_04495 [Ardenticatenaceae bacterium]|jgi:hypothetical protein
MWLCSLVSSRVSSIHSLYTVRLFTTPQSCKPAQTQQAKQSPRKVIVVVLGLGLSLLLRLHFSAIPLSQRYGMRSLGDQHRQE